MPGESSKVDLLTN